MKYVLAATLLTSTLALAALGLTEGEKGKPRPRSTTGIVSKVEAQSLTITQRGDSGERKTDFAIGAQTKILVQTNEDDVVKGEGGRERKVPRTKQGKLADVKVDQRVTVGYTDTGKADTVLILRPTPPRQKEGEK